MTEKYSREQLEEWDDQYVWHPFTPHSVYRDEEPLTVVAGEGNYLIDADGNRLLDAVASIWCNTFGHRRAEIDQAVKEQIDRIAHATLLGNAQERSIVLAKRLIELTPGDPQTGGLSKVFFSDNGSTAVEIAVKMALQWWQQREDGAHKHRNKFLGLKNAYNGDTIGAVSLGGVDVFHSRFRPLLFDVVRAPSPYVYHRPEGQSRQQAEALFVEEFDRVFLEHADELCAVVIEPGMQGAGGMITYPDGFLKHVRELTREHDVLLILDEVAMGMGRSGEMFACEREGVVPDFLCIAKGLTGGYLPVSATITNDRIYEGFLAPPEEGKTFFHGHTYTGNALGCAAAIATLDIFENDNVLEGLPAKIEKLTAELDKLRDLPGVGDIRQYGLAVGVELVRDRDTKEAFAAEDRVGMKICRKARDKGVFLRPLGDIITMMPPLSITDDEIEKMVDAVRVGIESVLPAYIQTGN
jgi:adenosylmethionine-8-amino-7-oxononanoate aminotransferase